MHGTGAVCIVVKSMRLFSVLWPAIGRNAQGRISGATAFCGARPWNSCPLGDRTLPVRTYQALAERARMLKHPGSLWLRLRRARSFLSLSRRLDIVADGLESCRKKVPA